MGTKGDGWCQWTGKSGKSIGCGDLGDNVKQRVSVGQIISILSTTWPDT